MTKTAKLASYIFHPVFLTFFNLIFILKSIGKQGPTMGFMFMLLLFFVILIPVFYTFLIVYIDKRSFKLNYFNEIEIEQRSKILAISVLHNLAFLIIVANLHYVFLGNYKTMISSIIMGMVLASLLSFIFHFFNFKSSLHVLSPSFFATFFVIFLWKIPGLDTINTLPEKFIYIAIIANLVFLAIVSIARISLKSHTWLEIAAGIFIGIISPLVLTLLSYGL